MWLSSALGAATVIFKLDIKLPAPKVVHHVAAGLAPDIAQRLNTTNIQLKPDIEMACAGMYGYFGAMAATAMGGGGILF